jgi:hypothetical protein
LFGTAAAVCLLQIASPRMPWYVSTISNWLSLGFLYPRLRERYRPLSCIFSFKFYNIDLNLWLNAQPSCISSIFDTGLFSSTSSIIVRRSTSHPYWPLLPVWICRSVYNLCWHYWIYYCSCILDIMYQYVSLQSGNKKKEKVLSRQEIMAEKLLWWPNLKLGIFRMAFTSLRLHSYSIWRETSPWVRFTHFGILGHIVPPKHQTRLRPILVVKFTRIPCRNKVPTR